MRKAAPSGGSGYGSVLFRVPDKVTQTNNFVDLSSASTLKFNELLRDKKELLWAATVLNTVQRRGAGNMIRDFLAIFFMFDRESGQNLEKKLRSDANPDKILMTTQRESPDKILPGRIFVSYLLGYKWGSCHFNFKEYHHSIKLREKTIVFNAGREPWRARAEPSF
ncbi:hypothetical protein GGX14DRAFT_406037 [Mycena pura]|uniref:Uncharacterized protein n=1 Tax=Mycena pura TaxID=153505 RepID=A0AAD6UR26_9AGAR|nr:hypothetical protein GGX14DRAFT_406037 [Mycena pura]